MKLLDLDSDVKVSSQGNSYHFLFRGVSDNLKSIQSSSESIQKYVPEREYFRWSYFPDYEELVPQQWLEKYKNISFPYNPDKRYHEEFEGFDAEYESGTLPNGGVKQADVVLLNYPLMWDMPDDVKRNDLELYEGITDANGPAMTWSIFTIKWVSFYNIASEASYIYFKIENTWILGIFWRENLQIWHEN